MKKRADTLNECFLQTASPRLRMMEKELNENFQRKDDANNQLVISNQPAQEECCQVQVSAITYNTDGLYRLFVKLPDYLCNKTYYIS